MGFLSATTGGLPTWSPKTDLDARGEPLHSPYSLYEKRYSDVAGGYAACDNGHGDIDYADVVPDSSLRKDLFQALAEFVGVTLMMFTTWMANSAAARQNESTGEGQSYMTGSIGSAFGAAMACFCVMPISGAALNPAVVVSLVVAGIMPLRKAGLYIVAEVLGGIMAAWMTIVFTPNTFIGANVVAYGVSRLQAFCLEVLMTAFLCLVVLALVTDKGPTMAGPVIIAIFVWLAHLDLIPFTGCSMNPASSIGGAIGEGQWANLWLFIFGPSIGGVVGSAIFMFFKYHGFARVENPFSDRPISVV
ncbi:hypothetical protein CXG81DRAFT_23600 [Caulochytrium protostelioides]|uniref:Aquaporin n=1 Tax=Caulochytrium protostelioides TaxID=1555241 RepID=A0A4P9XE15_9FUNG|nr:hypothetical protein CXG81DRAFT_23600 [Caulochytrium protostelioides]|eukprot:RKP03765.1 hypothetical protein CXG81DRAFT_23600 [Caulochytrium protostelioides]